MAAENKKYNFNQYVYFERWASYWYQIKEVLALAPRNVLVVGKGDGLVADFLRQQGIETKTLDCDAELSPDTVASVERLPLADSSFDVVLCAEVLEHLPFEKFEACLAEIKRVARQGAVLSLPHFGPALKLSFKIPLWREVKIALKLPLAPKNKIFKDHFWEIGKRGFSVSKIQKAIKKYFKIESEYVPFENQYHHFYRLKK